MKKIDILFKEFSELNVLKSKIINSLKKKKKSPFYNLLIDYKNRLSKQDREALSAINQRKDTDKFLWGMMYCSTFFQGNFFFWYLNKLFNKTKTLKGFNGTFEGLLNVEQFIDTVSEIEINAFFSNYNPLFNPKIKNSNLRLDSKINLEKRDIYFEIYTPRNTIPCDGIARELDNKSKGKIKDKIIRQIKECAIKEKKPVVLFINISYAGYMKHQIEDSFLGQGQYQLVINNKTGNILSQSFQRKQNGLSVEEPDSQYLSGIVFYSRKIFGFKVDFFEKDIIINSNAKYKLNIKEIKKLKRFDLRKLN